MFTAIPLKDISITGSFFSDRIETAVKTAIPYMWKALNDLIPDVDRSGCIHNFRVAAGLEEGGFIGCVFQDSDLWKWIEGAAYSLAVRRDSDLEEKIDSVLAIAAKAQRDDGYLDTYYIINGIDNRFTNLKDNHEMYVAGHMFEAAAAYYEATGKNAIVDIARGYADCLYEHFGPEDGKMHGYPGHEEVELGLARLYSVTGDTRYIALADYFLSVRGQKPYYYDAETLARGEKLVKKNWSGKADQWMTYAYYQANVPVREQTVARGHAVRQGYLLSGMAEVGGQRNDETLIMAAERVFRNIVEKQMYITGGVGATDVGEAYSFDYDLPNERCYNETCASIALIMTAVRLNRIHPSSVYGDVIEKCLYNGILSGVSLDGTKYFYMNPLEVWPRRADERQDIRIDSERRGWFGCACCPPNLLRTLTGLGSYLYTRSDDCLYIDQYVSSDMTDGTMTLKITSELPWKGTVVIEVKHDGAPRRIALRIPGWSRDTRLTVNNEPVAIRSERGYHFLTVNTGDRIELHLDMSVRFMHASHYVPNDAGKTAVMRGPLVYCLEEADNGKELWNLFAVRREAAVSYDETLLGGVNVISVPGKRVTPPDVLYSDEEPAVQDTLLRFVPYYAWGNRGKGEMCVWINYQVR